MKGIECKIVDDRIGSKIDFPEHATPGSCAMDLRACLDKKLIIRPGETVKIGSGIAVNLQDTGLAGFLLPRSSMATKVGIALSNFVGLIDFDYQGEVIMAAWNKSDTDAVIEPGERIAQLVFVPVVQCSLNVVSEFSNGKTQRGEGGFGSTGSN